MRRVPTFAAAAALVLTFIAPAFAAGIVIDHPWARETPKGAAVGAGYVKIENKGSAPDKLVSATFDDAGRVQIHEMSMDGGVMKMREIAGGVAIPAGGALELKPGGYHLMFMDLKAPLEKGMQVKGTLVFEKAGAVDVMFPVEGMGATGGGQMNMH